MTFAMNVLTADGYVSLLPVAWIILAAALVLIGLRTRNLWHLIFAAVFGVYLVFAIAAVFFPILKVSEGDVSLRSVLRSINLVPFNYDFSFIPHMVWRQIFENILLTVPFGFGISFVARLKPRDFLWLVPAVGIGLEGAQLLLALLGIARSIDINDVILNGLGVLIGYLLFRVFARLYVGAGRRFDVMRRGIFGYVYDVSRRADGPSKENMPEPAAP